MLAVETVMDNTEIHSSTCQNQNCEGNSVHSEDIVFIYYTRDILFFLKCYKCTMILTNE